MTSLVSEKLQFKPKSRLLLQLGDQLIKSESIAVLELVKNSYDALATEVKLRLSNLDSVSNGEIIIEDNGHGMSIETVKNVWMEPGTNNKEKQLDAINNSNEIEKDGFYRIPLGEKGIGRFGAHKLGNRIELISKSEGEKEVCLEINWADFETDGYLEDIKVEIKEREPEVFKKSRTGTCIKITNLRSSWSRGQLRDVYRSVKSLVSPFESVDKFEVNVKTSHSDWLAGLLDWEDIKDSSLFSFEAVLVGTKVESFEYNFTPWNTLKGLKGRTITHESPEIEEELDLLKNDKDNNEIPIDLKRSKVGRVIIKGYVFDRDPAVLNKGISDKSGLKKYLDRNGGVRVYRDSMRIMNYGEPGYDWLKLDARRVNMPSKRLSNNILVCSVNLERRDSVGLVEKTNREGFVENSSFYDFISAIGHTLFLVETLRMVDKEKIRSLTPAAQSKPVTDVLKKMSDYVDKKTEGAVRKNLKSYISRIDKSYKEITSNLLHSAGAGHAVSIAIHDVEKVLKTMPQRMANQGIDLEFIEDIKTISTILKDYSFISRKSVIEKVEINSSVIKKIQSNNRFRFRYHEIEFINEVHGKVYANCADTSIIYSLMNILDNSIHWLKKSKSKKRKILCKILEIEKGYVSIIIADNGPGFKVDFEDAKKAFFTTKKEGIGLGLHVVNEVMGLMGGTLVQLDPLDYDLGKEFSKGACLAINLKKA